eukprot:COSAG06_NODE_824_length_12073_cov_102.305161_15_plen_114_part_00
MVVALEEDEPRLTRHTSRGIDPHARRKMQRQINCVSGVLPAIWPDGNKLVGFRVAVTTIAGEHLVYARDVQHVACEKQQRFSWFILKNFPCACPEPVVVNDIFRAKTGYNDGI